MKKQKQVSKNEQKQSIMKLLFMFVIPIISFYLMEGYSHNPFQEVRPYAQFFNIILFELIAWLFFFLIGEIKIALQIEMLLAMIYGIANSYVVRFRTNPIVPWDIFSWKTAASVAGNYDYKPDTRMVLMTLIFLILIVGMTFVHFNIRKKFVFWKRLLPSAAVVFVLVIFAGRLQDESFQTSHRLYPFLFTPVYMTQVNGMAVTFVMDLAYVSVDKPNGYQAKEAEAVLASYEEETGSTEESYPNIIVVMNEAFSDLAVLGDFETNEDYMPFVHSLQQGAENTISGYLNVSVCGGNTANTEFEFLTGNSMAFLPQGSIPYQQYITGEMPSLASYLASFGYQTVATHPYQATGWDRDTVYQLLGFSDMIFLDEYEDAEYVRKYVSDDSCTDKIIELYEQKEQDTPLFVFNVTMQNHSSYTDAYENFTPDIEVQGVDNFALNQYLSLMKLSDAAFEKLVNYFANQEEETVIVFFGDHQPADSVAAPILRLNGKSVSSLTTEELGMRYEVPYVIWANFDIEEASSQDTSTNYLAANLLSAIGMPLPSYQSYLLDLEKKYPILSAIRVKKEDGTITNASEEKDGLNEYQSLQYYQIFDYEKE